MAESQDVCYAIIHAIDAIVTPLIGTTYQLPEVVDQQAAGSASRIVPNIIYAISRPLQKDLEDRLAAGKAFITVEPDEADAPSQQFVNEGRRMDLVSRTPLTVTATPIAPVGNELAWTIGGTITAGNMIGVQFGSLGAAYEVIATDTAATIAAGLAAAAVTAGIAASSSGSTFICPAPATINTGAPSTWLAAVSRRARSFDVLLWMPDPYLRHFILLQTDALFRPGQKLAMPDTSIATVIGTSGVASFNTRVSDMAGRDNLFLARTRWLIDFTITRTVTKSPVVAVTVAFDPNPLDLTTPLLASNL